MPGEPPGTLYPRGSYVFSSTVPSTRTLGRGLVRKLYHSSVRTQRRGSPAVAGDLDRRLLELLIDARDAGVIAEVRPDEASVPRPVVLGVGRGVDSRVA